METLVTFSVDDTSPCVHYSPFGDTFSSPNLISGWNPYFNSSGFAKSQGDVGVGTSLHITSLDGAALQLQWQGTGITLMGNATRANYTITLDGQILSDPATSDNVLANIQNLNDTTHTVQLTANIPQSQTPPNSSMIVFDQAILFSSPVPVANHTGFQNQTLDDQSIAFLGRWSVKSPNGVSEFHTTSTIGDQAVATFNGTTFLMLGQTSPSAGNYSVQLDNTTVELNAQSSFTQADSLLFFASDLDPTVLHTVTVKNTDGSDLSLLIGGFKAIVPSPIASPPSPVNTTVPVPAADTGSSSAFSEGTIAAFALAGILAFILISGVLFFFLVYRPRRRRRRRAWSSTTFTADKREPSPKEQEAVEGVLDIGPTFDDKSNFGTDGAHGPKEEQRKHWSALSGFQKWRREAVRGSFGGLGLGIHFRHSDSAQGRSVGNENGGASDNGRPSSAPTSVPSSSESAKRARAKRKGKARHVSGMSWTPSFTLDLPMHRQSRQSAGLGRVPSEQDLSPFVAANAPPPRQAPAVEPPSYAASISNRGSTPSSLIPSGPRSVSENSPAAHSAPLAGGATYFHGIHERDESHAFVLQEGSPDTVASGGVSWSAPDPTVPDNVSAPLPVRPLPSPQRHRATTPPAGDALGITSPSGQSFLRHIIDPRQIDTSLEATDLDNPSIVEPRIMREVLRSLSPRTSRLLPVPPPPPRRTQLRELVTTTPEPRSPEEVESPESVTSPTRRLLPQEPSSQWFSAGPRGVKPLPRTPTSDDERELAEVHNGVFLDVRETSPFRIDFEDSARTSLRALPPTGSDDSRSNAGGVSNEGSVSDPSFYSLSAPEGNYKPARNTFGASSTVHSGLDRKPSTSDNVSGSAHPFRLSEFVQGSSRLPFRLTTISFRDAQPSEPRAEVVSPSQGPSPATSDGVISFLDFTSSREGSLRVPSEKSVKKKRKRGLPAPPLVIEPKSRWSNTTVPSIATNAAAPEAGGGANAQGSLGESHRQPVSPHSEGRSTNSSTFPISVRVDIPASPYHIMEAGQSGDNVLSQDSSSNTHTADSLHVHPVLENIESPTESLPISTSEIRFRHPSDSEEGHVPRQAITVQETRRRQRSSMPDMSELPEEYRPRPFDPNVLVSRVLGMTPPTTPVTPRVNHSRAQSNVAMSSSRTSFFPNPSRHDSSNDQLNNKTGHS